ncbi:MAG: hypothetical protein NC418_02720 [Muribaculaceae bacterium]|nr:hypothetical protein [Muribaculaceae bacterium]
MNYRVFIFAPALAATLSGIAGASDSDINVLADHLIANECYTDSCTYEVLLATLSEPVSYELALESSATPSDTLSPCRYIVRWALHAPSGITEGFSAYFDGTHYRFRDSRLQEYHAQWSPEPFAPAGDPTRGVQQQAQFCELLPQFIGENFRRMASDSTYIYTVSDTKVDGMDAILVKGVRRYAGFDAMEYEYAFDAATLRPLRIDLETNPGQIGEQSIAVRYHTPGGRSKACHIDEATLIADRAEAFEKYRESSFTLESLPGRPMPRISAPTPGGERYHYSPDSGTPTVVVFADAAIESTPDVIYAVREAAAMLPMQIDIVWAFTNNRADDVSPLLGKPVAGETVLIHATGAARDCGIGSVTPVIIFVDGKGTVSDLINGYNQDLRSLVIQKASLSGM